MPSIPSNTKLLLHGNGTDASTSFPDSSGTGKSVSAVGDAQVDTAQKKFGTGSILLDGNGDYLSVSDSADWDFNGDFTVEMWVRFNNLPASNGAFEIIGNGYITGFMLQYYHEATTKRLRVWLVNNFYDFTWTPSTNTWYHLCVTRASNTLRSFIDGTQIGTDQTDSSTGNSANALYIGNDPDAPAVFDGWLDEVLIVKGTALYTANFTPNTEEYTTPASGFFNFF